jgi:hypothetical protein
MMRLGATQQARDFWLKCVDKNLLVTSPQKLLLQFERVYGETITRKYDVQADKGEGKKNHVFLKKMILCTQGDSFATSFMQWCVSNLIFSQHFLQENYLGNKYIFPLYMYRPLDYMSLDRP